MSAGDVILKLRALLWRVLPYMAHRNDCAYRAGRPCSCGLEELRDHVASVARNTLPGRTGGPNRRRMVVVLAAALVASSSCASGPRVTGGTTVYVRDTVRQAPIVLPQDTVRPPAVVLAPDTLKLPRVELPPDTLKPPRVVLAPDTLKLPRVELPPDTVRPPAVVLAPDSVKPPRVVLPPDTLKLPRVVLPPDTLKLSPVVLPPDTVRQVPCTDSTVFVDSGFPNTATNLAAFQCGQYIGRVLYSPALADSADPTPWVAVPRGARMTTGRWSSQLDAMQSLSIYRRPGTPELPRAMGAMDAMLESARASDTVTRRVFDLVGKTLVPRMDPTTGRQVCEKIVVTGKVEQPMYFPCPVGLP